MINYDKLQRTMEGYIRKDITILRQVVYKELMAWKRAYKSDQSTPLHDAMALDEIDKAFIDTQIEWFLMAEMPKDLVAKKAKAMLNELSKLEGKSPAQNKLTQDLVAALTAKEADEIPF